MSLRVGMKGGININHKIMLWEFSAKPAFHIFTTALCKIRDLPFAVSVVIDYL